MELNNPGKVPKEAYSNFAILKVGGATPLAGADHFAGVLP
jgi:hypothetical protein